MNNQDRQIKKIFITSLLVFVLLVSCKALQSTTKSSSVIELGNPLASDGKTGRALNIWDLQAFNHKIYLAGGSTVENAGPINVWAYNPATEQFNREYTVNEEAIERFRVFDNELYIPASDSRGADHSKFYRQNKDGQWQKYSSSDVLLAHVRDLIKTDSGNILLVGNSREPEALDSPSTAIFDSNGLNFRGAGIEKLPVINGIPILFYNWFFSVFSYQENIYAATAFLKNKIDYEGVVARYNSSKQEFEPDNSLSNVDFIPIDVNRDVDRPIINRLWNTIEYKGSLVYAVRSSSIVPASSKQDYLNSIGIFFKKSLRSPPEKAVFLDPEAVGEDLLVDDGELYALANKQELRDQYTVYVYKTNLSSINDNWQEVLSFSSDTRARSFETLDQNFYFGLGNNYTEKVNSSGTLLIYKR